MPWEELSTFSPTPGENEALEKSLTELSSYLFNPRNRNKFKDNLCRGEREALREMQGWNRDPDNPRVIRMQDKGFRFVIDRKVCISPKHQNTLHMKLRLGKQMETQMNLFHRK